MLKHIKLVNYLLHKKKKFNIWLKAAKRSAKWFSKEELLAIREYIFDEICVEKKSTTFVTSKNRPNSRGDTEKEIRFSYQQLTTTCSSSLDISLLRRVRQHIPPANIVSPCITE